MKLMMGLVEFTFQLLSIILTTEKVLHCLYAPLPRIDHGLEST